MILRYLRLNKEAHITDCPLLSPRNRVFPASLFTLIELPLFSDLPSPAGDKEHPHNFLIEGGLIALRPRGAWSFGLPVANFVSIGVIVDLFGLTFCVAGQLAVRPPTSYISNGLSSPCAYGMRQTSRNVH